MSKTIDKDSEDRDEEDDDRENTVEPTGDKNDALSGETEAEDDKLTARLLVRNLPLTVVEEELEALRSTYGHAEVLNTTLDDTCRRTGYGFSLSRATMGVKRCLHVRFARSYPRPRGSSGRPEFGVQAAEDQVRACVGAPSQLLGCQERPRVQVHAQEAGADPEGGRRCPPAE
ncbi:putative RNA-binding protein 19 [Phytophthora pseudosyringae]|uniref:Putative RNA-binding protein 19 n=1 Tax=Phytophthora pseudosyringae TaxID=221518 RepID=A0A8T1VCZ8_9STRA|nr:putative RNA-binding protein 19 [Phytophthora pseudosyringae]